MLVAFVTHAVASANVWMQASTPLLQVARRFKRCARYFALTFAIVCWHFAAFFAPVLPGGLCAPALPIPHATTHAIIVAVRMRVPK